jgi:hypothetical protein
MFRQSKGQFNPQQLYFSSHNSQQVEYASYTGPLTVKLIAGEVFLDELVLYSSNCMNFTVLESGCMSLNIVQ